MFGTTNRSCVILLGCFITTFLTGCAVKPIGVIGTESPPPSNEEAVVVLGVKPSTNQVVFVKGKINNGNFEETRAIGVLVGLPTDGYLIGKVQAGDAIGLVQFTGYKNENDRKGVTNQFCGRLVHVYTVPGGKISYLGDVTLSAIDRGSFTIKYSQNISAAREYIDSQYPALSGRLEALAPQVMPFKCPPEYRYYLIYR